MDDFDNETWLIETGDVVIEKKVATGAGSLSDAELLIYCLWVADYGMRNAGDLETASDLFAPFHTQGREAAERLVLPKALALFSMSRGDLERRYFDFFDEVCEELRALRP